MKRHMSKRPAFTLIELLVAVGIIAMLLGLVAISFPRFNEREQLTRAVDKLRTGLLTARLWAKRDQVVTGVLMAPAFPASPPSGYKHIYTSFSYVQQPLGNLSGIVSTATGNPTVQIQQQTSLAVPVFKKNDYVVYSGDTPHLIPSDMAFTSSSVSGSFTNYYFANMPLPNSSYNLVTGNNFRIIRSPQIIPMQEETFFQPDNGPSIGININDGSNNQIVLNNDMILFLPTGTIINSPSGTMILTVTQDAIDPNGSPETADVFLDCMSGTNRYISPN